MKKEYLELKWGTVKGWSELSDRSVRLLRQYFPEGSPMSVMMDHPSAERKKILCDLIDQLHGEIFLSWDEVYATKEEAKRYVLDYGTEQENKS